MDFDAPTLAANFPMSIVDIWMEGPIMGTMNSSKTLLKAEIGSTCLLDVVIKSADWIEDIAAGEVVGADLEGCWDNDDKIVEMMASQGFEAVMRENTFNCENDFDDHLQFTVYADPECGDWLYSSCMVAICWGDGGADPRYAVYSTPRLFQFDSLAESGFLDWVIGWYVTKDGDADFELQETSIGYSSNPTHELETFLDCLGEWEGIWCNGLGDTPVFKVKVGSDLYICSPYCSEAY